MMDCQRRDHGYPIIKSQNKILDRRSRERTEGRLVVVIVITVLVLFLELVVLVLTVAVVVTAVVWLMVGIRDSTNVIVVAIIGPKEQRIVTCYEAPATALGNRA